MEMTPDNIFKHRYSYVRKS